MIRSSLLQFGIVAAVYLNFSGLRSKIVLLFSIGSLCMVYNNSPQYKQQTYCNATNINYRYMAIANFSEWVMAWSHDRGSNSNFQGGPFFV